jgi:AcrR family transcriptional regulator
VPRVFSQEDRQAIRRSLLQQGRKQFLRYGLRKTNVGELARAAGIAKGTFYHFFDSKEELCLEIFHLEESDLSREILGTLERHPDATQALRAVMEHSLRFVRADSLLSRLRESGEYALLARGAGRARLARHLARDVDFVGQLLEALRRKGAACPLEPQVVAGILRAVVLLAFHEEEIGIRLYAPAMKHILEWIARGITGEGGRS